jgi:hypothetical protein
MCQDGGGGGGGGGGGVCVRVCVCVCACVCVTRATSTNEQGVAHTHRLHKKTVASVWICVTKDCRAYESLSALHGLPLRRAQLGKPAKKLVVAVSLEKGHVGLDFLPCDVLFHQVAVAVEQERQRVLGAQSVANLQAQSSVVSSVNRRMSGCVFVIRCQRFHAASHQCGPQKKGREHKSNTGRRLRQGTKPKSDANAVITQAACVHLRLHETKVLGHRLLIFPVLNRCELDDRVAQPHHKNDPGEAFVVG